MPSREISDLHPDLQQMARAFLAAATMDGLDPLVVCTYRSGAEQDQLYALGRTTRSHVGPWTEKSPLGSVVTRARAGQSAHNYESAAKPAALALDVYPTIAGKLVLQANSPLWQRLGKCGMLAGLEWYGMPGAPFREMPHFQHPHFHELLAIQRGESP
jgi:peptidoglycan LD-endopeptidase CwlK